MPWAWTGVPRRSPADPASPETSSSSTLRNPVSAKLEPHNKSGKTRAEIRATGSDVVADANFHLVAEMLPPNKFGYFLAGKTQGFTANPGGSQGNLCLGGQIGRFVTQIVNSGASGSYTVQIDLANLPPPLPAAVLAGVQPRL